MQVYFSREEIHGFHQTLTRAHDPKRKWRPVFLVALRAHGTGEVRTSQSPSRPRRDSTSHPVGGALGPQAWGGGGQAKWSETVPYTITAWPRASVTKKNTDLCQPIWPQPELKPQQELKMEKLVPHKWFHLALCKQVVLFFFSFN